MYAMNNGGLAIRFKYFGWMMGVSVNTWTRTESTMDEEGFEYTVWLMGWALVHTITRLESRIVWILCATVRTVQSLNLPLIVSWIRLSVL